MFLFVAVQYENFDELVCWGFADEGLAVDVVAISLQ